MLNWEKNGLEIFDNFHIDFNLPKWKERASQNTTSDATGPVGSITQFRRYNRRNNGRVGSGIFLVPENGVSNPSGAVGFNTISIGGKVVADGNGFVSAEVKEGFFSRLFGRAKKRRLEEEKRIKEEMEKPNFTIAAEEPKELEMTVEEFFKSVKNSAEELELIKERYDNYEKAVVHLKRTGQIAMLEMMENELEIHRAETQLFAVGFRQVITEDNLIQFAKKGCRELRLDWIKNFGRLIPEKALEAKEKCDQHNIFDNYVILHYDPYNNGVLKTEKEIEAERKKDPILFGVIAGSNKLYYVADWIDEYCDLTFDKIVDKLGEDAIKANDLTVEVKLTEIV